MVNDSTRVMLRRRRAWPPVARTAAVLIAAASLTLLAACGGGSSGSHVAQLGSTAPQSSSSSTGSGGSSNAGGSQTSQLLAFAQCMRSNGVPNFPDPTSSDKFPGAQQLGVSNSQYQAAMSACRHLLPNGGNAPNQAEVQQELTALRSFSQCMRLHGVPNWPDPTVGSDGNPGFNLVGIHGIPDQNSPQLQNAIHECGHLVPHALGGIRVRSP